MRPRGFKPDSMACGFLSRVLIPMLILMVAGAPALAQKMPAPFTTSDWYRLGETGTALDTPVIYVTVPRAGILKMAGDFDALLARAKPPNTVLMKCRSAKEQVTGLFLLATQAEYEEAVSAKAVPAVDGCLDEMFEWVKNRRRELFYVQLGVVNFNLFYLPKLWEAAPDAIKKSVTDMLMSLDGITDAGNDAYRELCPVAKGGLGRLVAYGGEATDPLGAGLSQKQGIGIQAEAAKLRQLILDGKHLC